jgi:hypothetical protein
MVIRLGGVFFFIAVVAWLYAIFDALTAPPERVRNLPKAVWLLIILLLLEIGAAAWFLFGRPRASVKARAPRSPFGWQSHDDAAGGMPRRSIAPDDDPDFLRRLGDDLRRGGGAGRDKDAGRDGDDPLS